MAFILRNDRRETENKTIRFPLDLINRIEQTLEKTDINFSRFVIQACEYALDEMEPNQKYINKEKEETHS